MYKEKNISTYLPNLDELSFLTVFEFPKASSTGLHAKIFSPTSPTSEPPPPYFPRSVKKFIATFADSVLPAPDSPEITIAYRTFVSFSVLYAIAEIAHV